MKIELSGWEIFSMMGLTFLSTAGLAVGVAWLCWSAKPIHVEARSGEIRVMPSAAAVRVEPRVIRVPEPVVPDVKAYFVAPRVDAQPVINIVPPLLEVPGTECQAKPGKPEAEVNPEPSRKTDAARSKNDAWGERLPPPKGIGG